jgi:hypothetical protein
MQMEHRAMKEVLRDLLKYYIAGINPQTVVLLGQPASPHKPQRPSALILLQFCTTNKLVEPQDVDSAIKMARLGNYSYLIMNYETGMVEVRIFTPWHELNEIIN